MKELCRTIKRHLTGQKKDHISGQFTSSTISYPWYYGHEHVKRGKKQIYRMKYIESIPMIIIQGKEGYEESHPDKFPGILELFKKDPIDPHNGTWKWEIWVEACRMKYCFGDNRSITLGFDIIRRMRKPAKWQ